jgi:lysophospholipase L1-like esterase
MMGPILGGLARMRFSSAGSNVVVDGNSLVYGQGSTGGNNMPAQLAAMSPLSGNVAVTNLGISGQNLSQMRTNCADVDAAYVAGKQNVLVVWEGTNSLNYGGSVAQAYSDTSLYCAERLALNPWIIVLMTTLPRYNQGATQSATDDYNAKLASYNAQILAGYKSMRAKAIVDVRQTGSPFAFSDYQFATFDQPATSGLWAAGETLQRIHLSNAGYGVIAQMVANVLKRLPRR